MQYLRRATQGLFLLLFLFLLIQTESKGTDELGYPVKIFLDFDPLILITTLLAAHAAAATFLLSLSIIVLTLLLGRVFCGWICPLGTLNNMVGALRKKQPQPRPANWFRMKYYILIFLIASSLFGMQVTGIMDPLSLLIRSLSVGVLPAVNYGIRAFFDGIYDMNPRYVVTASERVYSFLKGTLLSFQQPHYLQGALIAGLFLLILSLNLAENRFWCRYLCPLGGLLGLLSRFSVLRRSVSEGCTGCGSCASVCQGNASPEKKGSWRDTECLYCWNCDDVCPHNAVSFGLFGKRDRPAMDLGRRRVVTTILAGVAAVPAVRTTPLTKEGFSDPVLIRPPGSLEEGEFLKRCVKCGECMKVCVTNGLQPTLLEAGIEGIWSPMLVPRVGYCEYRCTLCGQVCPTGAIKRLPLEEKNKVKIGLAMIDKGRCLPWAHATACIVCEEVCPTPKKAIWLEEGRARDRDGREVMVRQPRVDTKLCIGCGICETKCPVLGRPAVYVSSVGESRSRWNRLLLS